MKSIGAVVLGCVLAVSWPSAALALDLKEWVPGLRVSPFLSERVEYQSNIFETPDDEKDDFIIKTIPGILVDYTFGNHSLSAGYRAEILTYVDLTNQDTVDHFAVFQLRLEFVRLILNLKDDFVKTSDPPGSELTGRLDSTTNTLNPSAEFLFTTRLGVRVNYAWETVDWEKSVNELDSDEHRFGGGVFWRFSPRADVGLNYTYSFAKFDHDPDRDFDRHAVTVGLTGELTAKLTSSLRFGWARRDDDRNQEFNEFVMGGNLTWRATERTSVSLDIDRSDQDSDFANNDFYTSTSGTVSVSHQFTPKLGVSARAGVGYNDYPETTTVGTKTDSREDIFWGLGAGVDYNIQPWLRVGADYSFTGRDSNFNEFDFDNHTVAARVTLQF